MLRYTCGDTSMKVITWKYKVSHESIRQIFLTLNMQLRFMEQWFHSKRLSLNISKTKYMVFGREKEIETLPLHLPTLTLGGSNIKRCYFTKFLGVVIDENLTWSRHISMVESKISRNIGLIGKARRYLNSSATRGLYFAFVHPYISFGNIAWGSTNRTKLEKIHKLQKRAVRVISYAEKTSHSRPIMKYHKILNIYELNIFQTLNFVYKHQHNMLPTVLDNYFQRVNHCYESRLSKFGYKEKFSKGKGRFCITSRGPFLWNRVTCTAAKETAVLGTFKQELKSFLLNSADSISLW